MTQMPLARPAALALLFPALAAGPALAQSGPTCLDRAELTAQLTERHEQQLSAGGLASPTRLIEVWTSAEGETFTILLTEASGRSCVLATGKNWTGFPEEIMGMMEGMQG